MLLRFGRISMCEGYEYDNSGQKFTNIGKLISTIIIIPLARTIIAYGNTIFLSASESTVVRFIFSPIEKSWSLSIAQKLEPKEIYLCTFR